MGQCSCQSTRIDQNNFLDLGDAFCVLTAIAIRSSPQGEGWRQPPAVRFPEVKAPSGVAPPPVDLGLRCSYQQGFAQGILRSRIELEFEVVP